MSSDKELQRARLAIKHNRSVLEASAECGCVNCLTIYECNQNFDWVDRDKPQRHWTALCQLCEEPFVIGDASDLPLLEGDGDLLNRLYQPLISDRQISAPHQ